MFARRSQPGAARLRCCYSRDASMIELVLSVCTIVQGASCHQLPPIPLVPAANMADCLMASQIEGAKWVIGHPNFYITRMTCRPVGAYAKI